jgi:hypothetical protein
MKKIFLGIWIALCPYHLSAAPSFQLACEYQSTSQHEYFAVAKDLFSSEIMRIDLPKSTGENIKLSINEQGCAFMKRNYSYPRFMTSHIYENEIICFDTLIYEPETVGDRTLETGDRIIETGERDIKIFIDRHTGIADYHYKDFSSGKESHDGVLYKYSTTEFYSREYKCQKVTEKKLF